MSEKFSEHKLYNNRQRSHTKRYRKGSNQPQSITIYNYTHTGRVQFYHYDQSTIPVLTLIFDIGHITIFGVREESGFFESES